MSVRAYRVIVPAQLARESSFNLWHERALVERLERDGVLMDYVDHSGSGTVEIDKGRLLEWLDTNAATIELETAETLRRDAMLVGNDTHIEYECY